MISKKLPKPKKDNSEGALPEFSLFHLEVFPFISFKLHPTWHFCGFLLGVNVVATELCSYKRLVMQPLTNCAEFFLL